MMESYSIEGESHYESVRVKHNRRQREMSREESLMYSKKVKRWAQPYTWLDHVVEECIVCKEKEKS